MSYDTRTLVYPNNMRVWPHEAQGFIGLLLQRTGVSDGQYRRIGFMRVWSCDQGSSFWKESRRYFEDAFTSKSIREDDYQDFDGIQTYTIEIDIAFTNKLFNPLCSTAPESDAVVALKSEIIR
ncbi:uncharacterized protein AB675_7188 [Cyphellophora attinorum]|uniref:Uncharacterized protein n=1 Tax=Cyphellophora attinorum TaxID=1664694 RepID=A0A0N1GXI3_9EURO|nr:uncharacterized protein AB675_7188 [Phialophora attinorum]KPI35050.1 hypothetical protein AB675_7188 [Phialophora attinorum]